MRPKIYKYNYNDKIYYAEGYDEKAVRTTLELYLKLTKGTLKYGKTPNFKKELKLIWDKKNTTHFLTLTKEQTTTRNDLQLYRQKQHCLYELKLLLKEDKTFLNGHKGDVIADEENQVKFWNSKYIKDDGTEIGEIMCYSFKGKTDDDYINQIYRFKNLGEAYKYVRQNIIKLGIENVKFNRNFTNLEICDSFISGFGSADLITNTDSNGVVTILEKQPAKKHNLETFKTN